VRSAALLNNGASNVGGLVKASAGLLTLSGNNGYTGATSVNAGTLTLASGGTLASGTVGVSAGATLNSQVGSLLSNATVLTADGLVNLFNGAVTLETLVGRRDGDVGHDGADVEQRDVQWRAQLDR
jgi:fibronectin-binding autotransporter adhesin